MSEMSNMQKFGLGSLVVITAAYVKFAFFPTATPLTEKTETQIEEQQTPTSEVDLKKKVAATKHYAFIYYLAQDKAGEEVYRAVKEEFDPRVDDEKIKFALTSLIKGPSMKAKAQGVYSEIPANTKILAITKKDNSIIIDLSSDFANGGGTDSIYKRLYQLIKTAKKNTNLPVYLYLDGKKADVIGGEGIMLTQPLSEKSLDE